MSATLLVPPGGVGPSIDSSTVSVAVTSTVQSPSPAANGQAPTPFAQHLSAAMAQSASTATQATAYKPEMVDGTTENSLAVQPLSVAWQGQFFDVDQQAATEAVAVDSTLTGVMTTSASNSIGDLLTRLSDAPGDDAVAMSANATPEGAPTVAQGSLPVPSTLLPQTFHSQPLVDTDVLASGSATAASGKELPPASPANADAGSISPAIDNADGSPPALALPAAQAPALERPGEQSAGSYPVMANVTDTGDRVPRPNQAAIVDHIADSGRAVNDHALTGSANERVATVDPVHQRDNAALAVAPPLDNVESRDTSAVIPKVLPSGESVSAQSTGGQTAQDILANQTLPLPLSMHSASDSAETDVAALATQTRELPGFVAADGLALIDRSTEAGVRIAPAAHDSSTIPAAPAVRGVENPLAALITKASPVADAPSPAPLGQQFDPTQQEPVSQALNRGAAHVDVAPLDAVAEEVVEDALVRQTYKLPELFLIKSEQQPSLIMSPEERAPLTTAPAAAESPPARVMTTMPPLFTLGLQQPVDILSTSGHNAALSASQAGAQIESDVGDRMLWMVRNNVQTAEVRLNPQHLGEVDIRVMVKNGETTVHFSSPNAIVREVLEQSLPRLRDMFEQQGLNLAGTDVSDRSLRHGHDQTGNFDGRSDAYLATERSAKDQHDDAAQDSSDSGYFGRRTSPRLIDVFA